jgi:hypothetical protein
MDAGESATRCSYNVAGGDKHVEEPSSRSDRIEGAPTVETGYVCLGGLAYLTRHGDGSGGCS